MLTSACLTTNMRVLKTPTSGSIIYYSDSEDSGRYYTSDYSVIRKGYNSRMAKWKKLVGLNKGKGKMMEAKTKYVFPIIPQSVSLGGQIGGFSFFFFFFQQEITSVWGYR